MLIVVGALCTDQLPANKSGATVSIMGPQSPVVALSLPGCFPTTQSLTPDTLVVQPGEREPVSVRLGGGKGPANMAKRS